MSELFGLIGLIRRRFALSKIGAFDFLKGVFFTVVLNLVLMLPAVFAFVFLEDYLKPLVLGTQVEAGSFWFYVGLGVVFIVLMWIFAVLQYRNTFTSVYSESANRRVALAEKLRKLPLSFFAKKNLTDLTSTIMSDNTELEHIFSHAVPQLFASIISIFVVAACLFVFEWRLALALFWVVPFALGIIVFSKKVQRRNNKKIYLRKREVSECIQEGLETICEIKSYGNEKRFLNEFDECLDNFERDLTRGEIITGVLVNGSQSLLKLGLSSVILVGAFLVLNQSVDLFVYLIFLIIGSRVFIPISEAFNFLAALFFLDVRIDRMNEMKALKIQSGRKDFDPKNFDVEFCDVDFSYQRGKKVLDKVSFVAKQGEVTALVGPSGGGKSTAIRLVSRFWDVDCGRVVLGGEDVLKVDPESLFRFFSFVFQDVVLFNTSVLENIRIGKRGACDEEVRRVARLANCEEFVEKLPGGFDCVIGENGETLSGGERQRISIARALLKDAPVILLDEATASLDCENESLIQSALSKLVENKTVLIIAHRMRTVVNADKIVVLEKGKVVESGSPEVLMKKDSKFLRMVKRQLN